MKKTSEGGAALAEEGFDLAGMDRPEKRTLRDQIHLQLRSAIMSGRFAPGQHLGIAAMAEALNVSAMPVREALRQLVAEGALEMLPNRMVKVPRLSPKDFRDVLEVRLLLEGRAAELAAAEPPAKLEGALQALSDRMAEASAAGEVARYFDINQDFHFALYRAAGSAELMRHIEMLWLRTGPVIRLVSRSARGFAASEENHSRIIAALRARDGVGAAEGVRRDLADAAQVIADTRALETPPARDAALEIGPIA